MYLLSTHELAAQRIADLHREAERDRLARALRTGGRRTRPRRVGWVRWPVRQARPARV